MTPSSGCVSGVLQLSQVQSLSSNLKGSVELQISSATNANFCQLDLKCTAVVSVTSVHVANASGYTRQLYINQDDFTHSNTQNKSPWCGINRINSGAKPYVQATLQPHRNGRVLGFHHNQPAQQGRNQSQQLQAMVSSDWDPAPGSTCDTFLGGNVQRIVWSAADCSV